MILKGKERGNGKQLATYLLTMADNEHVELHHLQGFSSSSLKSALQEIDAVSRGTRAKNSMFSLSLNPPPKERVSVRDFENAISSIEKGLGLEGQPRAIVFHEKDGRRHAHVVWSRIDAKEMKAINLPHFKLKLKDQSRQLFLDHGWQLPKGLINSKERDPAAYTRMEWEQAKRTRHDPKALKSMFLECWAASDGPKAFQQALKSRGYTVAQGDRRGHVAVDYKGEVYALSKWLNLKAKDVRARLGDVKSLPSVGQVKATNASLMTDMLRKHIAGLERGHEKQMERLLNERAKVVDEQRRERADLSAMQKQRWVREAGERAKRIAKGFRGIWLRVTGEYQRATRQNELEALTCLRRDRQLRDQLISKHLDERREFHKLSISIRTKHALEITDLHRDIATYTIKPLKEGTLLREPAREPTNSLERISKSERKPKGPDRSF